MEEQRQKLIDLIDTAYNNVQNPKFNDFQKSLLQRAKELNDNGDYIKVMLALRTDLLQADLSLNIKKRISGLPTEYSSIYYFIEPQLKNIDAKVLERYTHYGFIPLKFGSTVKYP